VCRPFFARIVMWAVLSFRDCQTVVLLLRDAQLVNLSCKGFVGKPSFLLRDCQVCRSRYFCSRIVRWVVISSRGLSSGSFFLLAVCQLGRFFFSGIFRCTIFPSQRLSGCRPFFSWIDRWVVLSSFLSEISEGSSFLNSVVNLLKNRRLGSPFS
jgi:hypothetical protein